MSPLALEGGARVAAGIILGIVFGYSLVRTELFSRGTFSDFFRFRNGMPASVILMSVSAGCLIFFLGEWLGLMRLNIRPGYFWGSVAGGFICGTALVHCRQVPCTAVALLASGRLYAFWIILGMLLAFPAVKLMSPILSDTICSWAPPADIPKTFSGYISPGAASVIMSILCLAGAAFFHFIMGGGSGDGSGGKK